MLTFFTVAADTDGKTSCRISVEPHAKALSGTVTIDRRIVRMFDETEPSFRSVTGAEWMDIAFWDRRCHEIAKTYSPFWRGEAAA